MRRVTTASSLQYGTRVLIISSSCVRLMGRPIGADVSNMSINPLRLSPPPPPSPSPPPAPPPAQQSSPGQQVAPVAQPTHKASPLSVGRIAAGVWMGLWMFVITATVPAVVIIRRLHDAGW
jgi:hypothetical protein